jgi:ribonuclease J
MKLLMHLTRPKFFLPIHGELRQLKAHAHLARQVGIPEENICVLENGQVVEFLNGEMRLGERIPNSYVFVDGVGVGDVGPDVMREREALSRDGIVLVHLTLDRYTNQLSSDPEVISRGFMVTKDGDELLQSAREKIAATVAHANGNMQKDIEQAVGNFLYSETHRRPMIFVTISRV